MPGPKRLSKRNKILACVGPTCLLALLLVGCGGTLAQTATPRPPTSPPPATSEPQSSEPFTPTPGETLSSTLEPASTPGFQLLANAAVGYRLTFPDDWSLRGQVVATQFALDAECQSVQIIDFQPPQGSGAKILHSLVQICARPLEDALTLEQFMIQTYGSLLGEQFEPVMFGGRSAYRTRNAGSDTTIFLQTQNHRVQIVSAVAAEPDVFPIRAAQVEAILASLTFAG